LILVDANILLYAEDRSSPRHDAARQWWDSQLSGDDPVALCWTVILAFVRIATNARVFERPLGLGEAASRVESWLDQPCTRIIRPTRGHWQVLQGMLRDAQAVAALVTDAHLAALAVEHGCTLCSTDADFAKFPRLKWRNPMAG
jgi:hypothetical protein